MEEDYIVFDSVYYAIEHYLTRPPTRTKSPSDFEPVSRKRPLGEHFSGDHPHDIHAGLIRAFDYLWRQYPAQDRRLFELYHMSSPRMSCKAAASEMGLSHRRARKTLDMMLGSLERELVRRKLVRPSQIYTSLRGG